MAPELALEKIGELKTSGVILDPMAGSGTVIRQATELGHRGIGYDIDPLAVLMTRVWTTPVSQRALEDVREELLARIASRSAQSARLRWIDDDSETADFITFWFGAEQRGALRRIAYAIATLEATELTPSRAAALDVFKLALSRIIITKERGASLARDVSHSRPHRVAKHSDYAVLPAFERSMDELERRLTESPPKSGAKTRIGDARQLSKVRTGSIDAVITSPPYLNAIDYMRGHKLSLVWMGHSLSALRAIRSGSIGSERAPATELEDEHTIAVKQVMGSIGDLPRKFNRMVDRYVRDILAMIGEVARVLKSGGKAVFVVGDSCLRGTFVRNSNAVQKAAELAGLQFVSRVERDLPPQSRYLPLTSNSLAKRMRTETVLCLTGA